RALRVAQAPRRFFSSSSQVDISESELLATPNHLILLGDPGSGKTTTAKRLARALIVHEPSESNEWLDYPIVLIARELEQDEGIILAISRVLGVDYKEQEPDEARHDARTHREWLKKRESALTEYVLAFLKGAQILLI